VINLSEVCATSSAKVSSVRHPNSFSRGLWKYFWNRDSFHATQLHHLQPISGISLTSHLRLGESALLWCQSKSISGMGQSDSIACRVLVLRGLDELALARSITRPSTIPVCCSAQGQLFLFVSLWSYSSGVAVSLSPGPGASPGLQLPWAHLWSHQCSTRPLPKLGLFTLYS
jgi:hypothetical protein